MRTIVIVALVAALIAVAFASHSKFLFGNKRRLAWNQGDFVGPTWQNRTAAEKKALLWSAVAQDTTSNVWPSTIELAQIFIESMNTTVLSQQDEMPKQGPFDLLIRKKLVHTVGAVASAVFKPTAAAKQYTGGFQGSNHLLIRLSLAKAPTETNIVPGVAVKFLRDKAISGNMFCMFGLNGQDDFNFFKNNFTNHIPQLGPDAETALKALRAKFSTASHWPEMTGLSKVALYAEDGTKATKPVFPFVIRLVPSDAVHTRFPSQKTEQTLEQQLATLDSGIVVYHVYAQAEPTTEFEQIGDIVTTSKFTGSKFGDVGLFFEHAVVENDLEYRPDWKKFLPQ